MIRKTHKLFKLLALVLTLAATLYGQTNNFQFVQHDTAYLGSDTLVILHGEIISLTNNTQSISVTRVTNEIDSAWTNSFCVGPACLPPFLNTFTFDLAGLDTAEFTLDTFTHHELGYGSWTIFAVDSSTMEVDSVHISMEVVTVSVDGSIPKPTSFELSRVYPNPTNASVNFDLELEREGDYSIILYALDGREIISRNYHLRSGKNHLQWSLNSLPSGNYIISAIGSGAQISRQLSVIK
ncbi:MAG: T9SS type A sorting domain-containing protein [Candidatus Marinimicrobia bacterium]|nr:T9SS type A sorting domain-containing protein [Candidatus Neomarinimicrobiota bacterium]